MTPDRLNEIGVLKRREIEARIVGPLLDALGQEFGRARVLEIAREVVIKLAREQGATLAQDCGGDTLAHFADTRSQWTQDDALHIEEVARSDEELSFNVTRCRYAEMYRALGIPELGAILSCNRDFSLIEGFNADIKLTRTQTIMQGAEYCDFRFKVKKSEE